MSPVKKTQYMRNLRHVQVAMRLGTGRRIELMPRGQRGDIQVIKSDELDDEIFLANKDMLFEVVSAKDAEQAITKQTTNQQTPHPALAAMRNERGEEYEGQPIVEESKEEQGTVVASVDDRGFIERFRAPGTDNYDLPHLPDHVAPEEASDWYARNAKQAEGPESGVAGLKVTKEPVQKTTPDRKKTDQK